MNAATKTRLSNIITAILPVMAVFQTSLTHPPFSQDAVLIGGAVITYATMLSTAIKQALSAEVNSNVSKFTLIATAVAGLGDLLNVFQLTDQTQAYIRLGITITVTVVNILSKQLFPSDFQKDKIQELKQQ